VGDKIRKMEFCESRSPGICLLQWVTNVVLEAKQEENARLLGNYVGQGVFAEKSAQLISSF